jgi:hypothetical protein
MEELRLKTKSSALDKVVFEEAEAEEELAVKQYGWLVYGV